MRQTLFHWDSQLELLTSVVSKTQKWIAEGEFRGRAVYERKLEELTRYFITSEIDMFEDIIRHRLAGDFSGRIERDYVGRMTGFYSNQITELREQLLQVFRSNHYLRDITLPEILMQHELDYYATEYLQDALSRLDNPGRSRNYRKWSFFGEHYTHLKSEFKSEQWLSYSAEYRLADIKETKEQLSLGHRYGAFKHYSRFSTDVTYEKWTNFYDELMELCDAQEKEIRAEMLLQSVDSVTSSSN